MAIFLSAWQKQTQNFSRGFDCFQPRFHRSLKSKVPLRMSTQFKIKEPLKQIQHGRTSQLHYNPKDFRIIEMPDMDYKLSIWKWWKNEMKEFFKWEKYKTLFFKRQIWKKKKANWTSKNGTKPLKLKINRYMYKQLRRRWRIKWKTCKDLPQTAA